MNFKLIIAILLILFSVAALVYTFTQSSDETVGTENETEITETDNSRQIFSYYLHGQKRCNTCNKIETYSHEALQATLSEKTAQDVMVWKTINFEEPGNEHFIADFDLYAHSLVLVEYENSEISRYKNLEQVWDLVGDKEAFLEYVESEMQIFLEGV